MSTGSADAEDSDPTGWRSYRCPVCGHTDEVVIAPGASPRIQCSHCDALLEVALEKEGAESVSVRLVEEGSGGGSGR